MNIESFSKALLAISMVVLLAGVSCTMKCDIPGGPAVVELD